MTLVVVNTDCCDAAFVTLSQVKFVGFSGQALGTLSWSLARMDVKPKAIWLESFLRYSQQQLPALATARRDQPFTNIIWALACWEYVPPTPWLQEFCRCDSFFALGRWRGRRGTCSGAGCGVGEERPKHNVTSNSGVLGVCAAKILAPGVLQVNPLCVAFAGLYGWVGSYNGAVVSGCGGCAEQWDCWLCEDEAPTRRQYQLCQSERLMLLHGYQP